MQIEIIKDGELKKVSKSAFKNFFENAGWVESNESTQPIVSNEKQMTEENIDEEIADEEIADEAWDDDIDEKPLSEMNRNELISLADRLGVDISGMSKNAQIRDAIKSAM